MMRVHQRRVLAPSIPQQEVVRSYISVRYCHVLATLVAMAWMGSESTLLIDGHVCSPRDLPHIKVLRR